MAITDATSPFGANDAGQAVSILPFSAGRTPLNIAAAQVAATLKHRFITPGILAGLARLADFVGLALVSVLILALYVDPGDAGDFGYVVASLLLPAAAVVLIGSINGYAIGDYRRTVVKIGRGAAVWSGVFGC